MHRTAVLPRMVIVIGLMALANSVVAMADTEVSSCGTLSNAGNTYRLVADLTSTGTCLELTGSDITLDGAGHTITYTSDGADEAAIYARYASRAVIHHVTINMTNGVSSNGPSAIRSKGEVTVNNCTVNVVQNGDGSTWGIRSLGGGDRAIHHNTLHGSGSGSVVLIAAEGVSDSSKLSGSIHDNHSTLEGSLKQSPGSRPAHVAISRSYADVSGPRMAVYSNTMINASSTLRESQGVTLFEANNMDVYDNVYNDSGGHSRAFNLDYAENCTVHGNVVNQGSSAGGANQGISLRYGSNGNEFYENTITANGNEVFNVIAGAEGAQPYNNTFHDNVFIATDHAIRVRTNIRDLSFHNNRYIVNEGSGAGYAVYFLEYHTTTGGANHIEDVYFSYSQITNNTSKDAVIRFQDNGDDGPDNVVLCGMEVDGSPLSGGNVSVNSGANDYAITTDQCVAGAPGGGTDPPVDPPAAPANLRRTDKRS